MSVFTSSRNLLLAIVLSIIPILAVAQPIGGKIVTEKMKTYIQPTRPLLTGYAYNLTLPFMFNYDGKLTNKFYLYRHGVLYMQARLGYLPVNQTPGSRARYVSPYSTFLYRMNNQGGMRLEMYGTAPKRHVVIAWENYALGYGAMMNKRVTFELILFETSNNIEFRYKDMKEAGAVMGWQRRQGSAFFSGQDRKKWINIEPGVKSKFHFGKDDPSKNKRYITTKTSKYLPAGKTYILSKPEPKILDVSPKDLVVWTVGSSYDAPYFKIERDAGQPEVTLEYKIYNKFNKKVLYQATNEGDITNTVISPTKQPVGEEAIYRVTHARGIGAKFDPAAPNSVVNDGKIVLPHGKGIQGGAYMVEAKLHIPSIKKSFSKLKTIIIAMERDIAISRIIHPRPKDRTKYVMNSVIPLEIKVSNYGIQDVHSVKVTANIYNMNNQLIAGPISASRNLSSQPLKTGEYTTVPLNNVFTNPPAFVPGLYKIKFEAELLGATDVALENNVFPRANDPDFVIQVVNDVDVSTDAIINPKGNIYIGCPVKPVIKFTNHGINDLANVPVKVKIVGPNSTSKIAFEKTLEIESLQSGNLNTTDITFDEPFIPTEKGNYQIQIDANAQQDKILANDLQNANFDVVPAMSGTYSIGGPSSATNNFPTMDAALNTVYQRGITGPVIFELHKSIYNWGDPSDLTAPALDLSSRIIGASQTNTITFKASTAKEVSRAGVTINLNSGNGVGILIGQNSVPKNSFAAVHNVNPKQRRKFSNSSGYFIFDGGSQKSLRFVVKSKNDHRSVFYLSNGASNNTIKNCILDGGSQPSFLASLPLTTYSPSKGAFIYESDNRSKGKTYSAGITMRSIAPRDNEAPINTDKLDTLSNNNNIISQNDISGFAYGVVSMGTGVLYQAGGTNKNKYYYNTNNLIERNIIHNVARAGVFVGYAKNSKITNNRIFDVKHPNNSNADAAGILVGGLSDRGYFGYNTIGTKVNGNEISNVQANSNVAGISVEQSANTILGTGKFVIYPTVPENTTVANNIVWGLKSNNKLANKYGIHLFTERQKNTDFLIPKHFNYNSRNDYIVNNTIIMYGDDDLQNEGILAGISINNTRNTVVKNNAISVLDNSISPVSIASSAIVIQNPIPSLSGLVSDYNVFWHTQATSTMRYFETDILNKISNLGSTKEYIHLDQWQNWQQQDRNSVVSNFNNDLVYSSNNPKNLRIKSGPYPLGSVLNNRGDNLTIIKNDLQGIARGMAGQRYDIGAIEFNGKMSIDDMEVMSIIEPAAYKSTVGKFADAEYIMTKPEVNIVARLRNNGSLFQTAAKVTLKIYMETPQGTFTVPVFTKDLTYNSISGESIDIDFDLATNKSFIPKTYSQLRNVPGFLTSIPEHFKKLTANVTPRYKLEIILENDEQNNNNNFTKVVRFFVQKSWLNMIVTSENVNTEITATSEKNIIAGNLNHAAVIDGLNTIGWKIDISGNDLSKDRYDFDVMDRNCWEERGIDYSDYRTVIWSDGHDISKVDGKDVKNTMSRFQKLNITKYMNTGKNNEKKTFLIASQELARNNGEYASDMLRITQRAKATKDIIDYSSITGMSIGRNLSSIIKATTFTGDIAPNPALVDINNTGNGISKLAYYYSNVKIGNKNIPAEEKIMGVTTSTIGTNRAFLGTDWRHFGKIDQILRQAFDFIETNGGVLFAVDLIDFDAQAVSKRVNLSWSTASEKHSSHFEIERSLVSEAGNGVFVQVADVDAVHNSKGVTNYNTVDTKVQSGNAYYYRLKMIDNDGTFQYSKERLVELGGNSLAITVSQLSANPVRTTSDFTINLSQTTDLDVTLFDITGNKVISLGKGSFAEGSHLFSINALNISSGHYTIVIHSGNFLETRTVKIIK